MSDACSQEIKCGRLYNSPLNGLHTNKLKRETYHSLDYNILNNYMPKMRSSSNFITIIM
jgi:hypothetical protein